jgi:hypothetical protein
MESHDNIIKNQSTGDSFSETNMANSLAQIENAIRELSYDERLWLIERLIHGLRKDSRPPLDAVLAEMAADPQMRRELTESNSDGLA